VFDVCSFFAHLKLTDFDTFSTALQILLNVET